MLKKLRIKFVCMNMTIITIMLVVILCMVVRFTRHNIEQRNLQMLQEIAHDPVSMIPAYNNPAVRIPCFSLRLNQSGSLQELIGNYYSVSSKTFYQELINASFSCPENTGILSDYSLQYMRISTPTGHFLIFIDITTELSTLENLTRNCIIIGISGFFVFLGISIFFANRSVRPVDKAWTQQKQFIADASHQLKTPLTVILTNAELLQSSESDPDATSHFSSNILTMGKQMQGLVEGLLELSRIDNGSMKTVMKELDFSTLVQNTFFVFEPLYFENGLELKSEIEPDVYINGSETHLRQVVEILLDNALKYSVSPSQAIVRLQKQHCCCVLSVSSHGSPLSDEELKNIFKRFYRTDDSRKRADGYGLGLSIAESIVSEHHGRIWAESDNGVNTFSVCLH
ncbi:MAG: sensor histidine kinase [Butyrivibrio sp.]